MFLSEEGRLFWDVFIGFMVFLDLLIVPYDAASSISLGHIFGTREGHEESTAFFCRIYVEPFGSSIIVAVL